MGQLTDAGAVALADALKTGCQRMRELRISGKLGLKSIVALCEAAGVVNRAGGGTFQTLKIDGSRNALRQFRTPAELVELLERATDQGAAAQVEKFCGKTVLASVAAAENGTDRYHQVKLFFKIDKESGKISLKSDPNEAWFKKMNARIEEAVIDVFDDDGGIRDVLSQMSGIRKTNDAWLGLFLHESF